MKTKTWDEYCDEVAKKYPNVYALTDESIEVAIHLNKVHEEAATLYAKEKAKEAIGLARKTHNSLFIAEEDLIYTEREILDKLFKSQ